MKLKERVLRAGSWVLGGYFFSMLIRLGSNLIMTRLLAPEMFGLMALVLVFMTALAMLSDFGLPPIVVHSQRGEDPTFLNTLWVIQVIRGLMLWMLAWGIGAALWWMSSHGLLPPGSAYAHSELPWVVVIYAVTQLIAGFLPTKLLLARRHLALAKVTQIDLFSQVVALVIMVAWANLDPSVWALVGGSIAGAAIKLPLYWRLLPGPGNRWRWDTAAIREVLHFGKWVFLSSTIGYLVASGDRLILGALVGARELGIYSIAFLFASIPQLALSQLMNRVAFPALAEVARTTPGQLHRVYYRFRLPFDLASLGIAGALSTAGTALIIMLYDHRYHDAGPLLQILCLSTLAFRYQLADQCYLALGRSEILARIHIVRLVSLYVTLPIAFQLAHLEGAVWAIVLSSFLSLFPILYYKTKFGLLDLRKEALLLLPFVIGAGVGKLLSWTASLH